MTSVEEQKCVHKWIIEIAQGPMSKGECIYCGEQKSFMNYLAQRSLYLPPGPSQLSDGSE